MSLDKAIKHGKEKRKQYRGAKAVDCTCRNHGSCGWCLSNRLHKFKKKEPLEDTFETLSNSIALKNNERCLKMNKYIDINELGIGRADPKIFNNPEYANGWNSAIEIIEKAPASEVVEVVRCKNCKYYHQKQGWCDKHSYFYDDDRNSCRPEDSPDWTMFLDNDFCSYGERR